MKNDEKESMEFVEMMNLVDEINKLAMFRRTLSLGTNTGDRNSAESTLSRRITNHVNELSRKLLSFYKES